MRILNYVKERCDMSKIMSIWDLEFTEGKKISKKSSLVKTALRQIQSKRHFEFVEYEKVISLAELILTMYDIDTKINNKRKQS